MSGVRSSTTRVTSRPLRHTVNEVSGPPSAAMTSLSDEVGVGGDQDVHDADVTG